MPSPAEPAPTLSLVVSMHGVEAWLPAFLTSLERQGASLTEVQLVFVDDGSPDRSRELVDRWLTDRRVTAEVVAQPNGGLSAARNSGLDRVTGAWVSFPDPDDVLADGYLAHVLRYLRSDAASTATLASTNIVFLEDATGELQDSHPLRFRFEGGVDSQRRLAEAPHFIHLSAATGLYRVDTIRAAGLRFDTEIMPFAEDLEFTARYLFTADDPVVAVLPAARYHYRRRADSLVASSYGRHERYTVVPQRAYLPLLQDAAARWGAAPAWLQNVVLYDLQWYFKADEQMKSPTGGLPLDVREAFLETVERIFALVSPEAVTTFWLTPITPRLRMAWLAMQGAPLPRTQVRITQRDPVRGLVQARYLYGGAAPSEEFRIAGRVVEPLHAKHRAMRLFGRTVLHERIAWLPAEDWLEARLDGVRVAVLPGDLQLPGYTLTDYQARKHFRQLPSRPRRARPGLRGRVIDELVRGPLGAARRRLLAWRAAGPARAAARLTRQAASPRVRARFADAWTLIDRDYHAGDNAEAFARYLKDEQPGINSWFVLTRDSGDWDRLAAEGFRLVAHGTREHHLLLLNSAHLITSQADHYIVHPLDRGLFPDRPWRVTFLQHGVTKDDLSHWLNGKPFSRFITATDPEFASIVDDDTPYTFTTKEVVLTGFPRHDRLLAVAGAVPEADRDLVLFMPTWRSGLAADGVGTHTTHKRVWRDDFWESEFARNWFGMVGDDRLRARLGELGLRVGLLPHPNMEGLVTPDRLPTDVELLSYTGADFAAMLARARVVVTDYSSNGFEAAITDRPVVYFQFDQAAFFDGTHAYRKGYFDYEADGFGPVVTDLDAAADATLAAAETSGVAEPYAGRIARTFTLRDGRASERVYRSLLELDRRDAEHAGG